MTRQVAKTKSVFPNIPRSSQAVDENGHLTPQWSLAFNSLFQTLQTYFTSEGFGLPLMTPEDQQKLVDFYNPYINKRLPPGVRDLTSLRIMDTPYYDQDSPSPTDRKARIFIIQYKSDKTIANVQWKEFNIT